MIPLTPVMVPSPPQPFNLRGRGTRKSRDLEGIVRCSPGRNRYLLASRPAPRRRPDNGTAWRPQMTAQPPSRKTLLALSCAAVQTCTAVGFAQVLGQPIRQPLAEHE